MADLIAAFINKSPVTRAMVAAAIADGMTPEQIASFTQRQSRA